MKTKLLLAAGAFLSLALPANAVIVNAGNIGFTGTTLIQGQIEGAIQPGLIGTLGLTYTGQGTLLDPLDTSVWNFNYTVKNLSGAPVTASRISSFAFQTDPNIIGATSTGVYNDPDLSPGGWPGFLDSTVEFCLGSSPGTCTGGGGTTIGGTNSGTFSLTFADPNLLSINLQAAFFRFQAILPGTLCDKTATEECSGAGENVNIVIIDPQIAAVPLPPAVFLFGSVLLAVFGAVKLRLLRSRFVGFFRRRETAFA